MIILGISLTSHDSGAAIIKDGRVIAAANEERFSRKKMDDSTPYGSIESVMEKANLTEADIDILAFSDVSFGLRRKWLFFMQQAQRVWFTRLGYLRSFLNPRSFNKGRLLKQTGILGLQKAIESKRETKKIISNFQEKGFKGGIKFIDHDIAHAATAYYTSGQEKSFIAVVEGSSLINACSFWTGQDGVLKKIMEIPLPHSPGRYYEIVTLILGFHPKRHGGKITGLAAFGDPNKCYHKVEKLLFVEGGQIKVGRDLYSLHDEYFRRGKKIPKLFEKESKEDIAAAFQKRLEDVVLEQIKYLANDFSVKNISLAGGVFANVKLNMEISKLPQVKNIFIHPGMGDVGQSLGVALQAHAEDNKLNPYLLKDVYFGPSFDDKQIEIALKKSGVDFIKTENISYEVAKILADNKVVGFFQGGMEYGPRALGARSILYPATDPEVNTWLNNQLKRTEFMPFAPVTLAEEADKCYKSLDKCRYAANFMTIAVPVTSYMAKKMPAAVHIDKTARPQLISREANKVYYDTLKEYKKITGLPSIINTSFNMHEEPIVCKPEEAIKAYQLSNLDALAIENYLVINKK
mgnify:CR=1 FL=1